MSADLLNTALTRDAGIDVPLIGGAMYPCGNPELVAAVSAAGGIGIVQPVSLTYVHGYEFRDGLRYIRDLTSRPIGFNALIEKSSRRYRDRMAMWVDTALAEGIRFFVTSLGNPAWVVERAAQVGGVVYHDVTERKWAQKAVDGGVHGLIAVNDRAGGHAGPHSAESLLDQVGDLGLPVVCAGGVGGERDFVAALHLGYSGVQMGTRFIATVECSASEAYKQAIISAGEDDVVLSDKVTGVPLAVLRTPYVDAMGTRLGPVARRLLKGRHTKHWVRSFYALKSGVRLARANRDETGRQQFWQAGKSVAGVASIEEAGEIVRRFVTAASR
ncbi:MAG: nitronate monooxygenase [marine benthic group bacterium]|nr:nitronate monooxygenase [Gemmatimonadota bacterium]